MGSSRHPDLLANLLQRSTRRELTSVALGGGVAAVGANGELITPAVAARTGSLDVFIEADPLDGWIATGTLPIDVPVHFAGVWTGWQLIADATAAELQVDVLRDSLANFPPTLAADKITGTAPPLLTGTAYSASSSTLTGWTTAFYAGDVLRLVVSKVWRVNRATLSLKWERT